MAASKKTKKKRTRKEPVFPANSIPAALVILLGDRGEVNRRQAQRWLQENEERLWDNYIGPMVDKIEKQCAEFWEDALEDKDDD